MLALDTSVAIPLLVQNHGAHAALVRWWNGREVRLSDHAQIEIYSVLTRLPGDLRLSPSDAAGLIGARFGAPLPLKPATARSLPELLASLNIGGGAVYDAVVALAALDHGAELATRDARAKATYDAVGVRVVIAA